MIDILQMAWQNIQANPLGYLGHTLFAIGTGLLLAGIAMGFGGYYLKAYSSKALGDAASGTSAIAGIWGNIAWNPSQVPYLSVTTPNVANDIVNGTNDAFRGLYNAAGDMAQLAKDIAAGLDDIARTLAAMVTQGPGIAINGILGLVSEGISDLFILIFPWAIIIGAILMAVGGALLLAQYILDNYVTPAMKEWFSQKIGSPLKATLDKALGIIHPTPPVIAAGTAAETPEVKPEEGGGRAVPSASIGPPPDPSTPPVPPTGTVSQPSTPPGNHEIALEAEEAHKTAPESDGEGPVGVSIPPESPDEAISQPLEPATTETTEEVLGEGQQTAGDRMRAAVARRDMELERRRNQPDLVDRVYAKLPEQDEATA